ncbi:MAG: non-ribosomal peptide synthetase [Candidatus Binatia bacterium]
MTIPPTLTVPRRAQNGHASVSPAQRRLWILHQLDPNDPSSNRPVAIRLTGRLEQQFLLRSLNEIIRRHEILRTVFPAVNGEPFQVVRPFEPLPLAIKDLRHVHDKEIEAAGIAAQEAREIFDPVNGPLVRAVLLQLNVDDHVLLLLMHHLVFDGWSEGILLRELRTLYDAFANGSKASPLPDLPIQYSDFAAWQHARLSEGAVESQLSYWRTQLEALSPLLLPADYPTSSAATRRAARHSFLLPVSLAEQLKELSRRERVTLFMVLLSGFQLLLSRYSRQEDFAVGVPIAGRIQFETEGLIGCFVNILLMRSALSGDPTVREVLSRTRKMALAAYASQEIPFEKLVEELRPARAADRWPLLQVMFNLRNLPKVAGEERRGLRFEPFSFDSGVIGDLDLSLEAVDRQDGLHCLFTFPTTFSRARIERMSAHFETLLEGMIAHPEKRLSTLPMLTRQEQRTLLVEWNDTKREYPQDECIHRLFEEQAERAPDAVAVVYETQELSYRELNQRANQLAHYLKRLGAGGELLVGICMERSVEMIIGLLGILKAGGAYLPLDPSYPRDRLRFMIEDAQPASILTQQRLLEILPQQVTRLLCLDQCSDEVLAQSQDNPKSGANSDNLAYVIFTSGSTGKPKGVQISHRGVINVLTDIRERLRLAGGDISLFVANLSFDISVMEVFLPLIAGASMIIVSRETATNPDLLVRKLASSGATVMHTTPAMWQLILQTGWQGSRNLRVLCGGEALPPELAKELARRGSSVWNLYGPTETTIYSSAAPCLTGENVSIGRPIANTQIYLLDDHFQPAPIGVFGELYVGGDGLARGYLNSPAITAERFLPNPFSTVPGARLYKTGDLARYLTDGNIEYADRLDRQVKIRGFRIELGEIEAVLGQHPAVRQAAVLAREDIPGDKRLVAYLVLNEKSAGFINELRGFLKQKLPDYMIPATFVTLDSLPLTVNGKIDRRALPAPDQTRPELEHGYAAPRTEAEEVLARIWAEVLKVERVGVHDDFFDLGGHSLLATQVASRVREALQVNVPLRLLFDKPTIAELAEVINDPPEMNYGARHG